MKGGKTARELNLTKGDLVKIVEERQNTFHPSFAEYLAIIIGLNEDNHETYYVCLSNPLSFFGGTPEISEQFGEIRSAHPGFRNFFLLMPAKKMLPLIEKILAGLQTFQPPPKE
jgi:hypothetical protein